MGTALADYWLFASIRWLLMGAVLFCFPLIWKVRLVHGPTYPELRVNLLTWTFRIGAGALILSAGLLAWGRTEREVIEAQVWLSGGAGAMIMAQTVARIAIGGAAMNIESSRRRTSFQVALGLAFFYTLMGFLALIPTFIGSR